MAVIRMVKGITTTPIGIPSVITPLPRQSGQELLIKGDQADVAVVHRQYYQRQADAQAIRLFRSIRSWGARCTLATMGSEMLVSCR